MQVHRELGPGFLESVYQRSLAVQLREHGIAFEREVALEVTYHGESVGTYRADFICHGTIIVELKALPSIGRAEVSQLAHYMRATNQTLGLLLNFGSTSLQYQRVVGRQVIPRRHELDADDKPRPESVKFPKANDGKAPNPSVESVFAHTPSQPSHAPFI
ncbi:MAG: hypothetical protein QOJ26_912 [Thermoplasmata archaeon]|nr:hypothetical protein [Thermoplasmata archaeon]